MPQLSVSATSGKTKARVRITDVRDCDEYLKRVLLVRLADAPLDFSLDLSLALFAVT